MRVDFSRRFIKRLKKAPVEVKLQFRERFEIFKNNKFHPLLNNHALGGKYGGCRSINITGNWRAVFKEVTTEFVLLVDIGTHPQLYG